MDDTLVGLTFLYDSESQSSSNVPGRPVRQISRKSVELINEQDNIKEKTLSQKAKNNSIKKNKVKGGHKKASRVQREVDSTKNQSRRTTNTQGHRSNDSYDTGGECFTCLPGIEDTEDTNKITEMSESSDSSSKSVSPVRFAVSDRVLPLDNDSLSTQQQGVVDSSHLMNSPVPPPPQNYWLMRLFQSNLFDMSIAIGYLFNSKEADVQAYLGNKLFVSEGGWVVVWVDRTG